MTNWLSSTLGAVRRSPSASALLLVMVMALLESFPLEALVWEPSTTPAVIDQALLLGFIILVLGAMLAWYGLARPIEAALRESRHTLKSLFVGNPESIAVYDLDGRIARGNRAAATLLDREPKDLIGAHFDTHVASDQLKTVQAAFDRAAAGEFVELETVFITASGKPIEVQCLLTPHIVDGSVAGVFGVVRDATEINDLRARLEEQVGRVTEIAQVADSSRSTSSRLHGALALLCRRLQFEEAYVAEIDGERVHVLLQETAGPGEATAVPIEVMRRVATAGKIVEIGNFGATTVRSFAGLALRLSGGPSIVLALTSPLGREREFDAADVEFIRTVSSLIVLALERGRQDERSGQQAFHDALTGLPNRLLVIERLSDILSSPKWRGMHFAVHYVDLEGFQEINADFGHAIGDRILRLAARRIQDSISSLDLLARLGGDEFAVVQPLPDGDAHADKMARRIMAAVAQPFSVEGTPHQLGVSIGISISSNSAPDGLSLLQHADEALYRAKHETEHRLSFKPDLSVAS